MNENCVHVCITLRQLLIGVCDSLITKRQTTIIFLTDYQCISELIQQKLIDNFCEVDFLFIKESLLIDEFTSFSNAVPGILRRNISVGKNGTHLGCSKWIPEILSQRRYNIAYVYHSGPFTAKVIRSVSKKIILREDGLSNYVVQRVSIGKAFIRCLCGLSPFGQVWGEERWVDSLEVETPELLPERVVSKARQLKISSFLSALSTEHKAKFIDSFELQNIQLDEGHKNCLILTQPIDDVGFCNPNDKAEIYRQIAEAFSCRGYSIFVKHHPKENDFVINMSRKIPKQFPVELLSYFINRKFDVCVALCTSSLVKGDNSLAERELQLIPLSLFNAKNFSRWEDFITVLNER